MITKEILLSHPVSVLKKEISKTNIKGYSKMRKLELIELMMKPEHTKRFGHIKMGASYIPGDLKPLSKAKKEPVKKDKKIGIKRTPKPAPKPEIKITTFKEPKKKVGIKRTPKPAPKPAPGKFSLPFPPKSTSGKPTPKFNDKNRFTPFQVSTMSTQTLKANLNLFIDFSKYFTKDEILFYKELKDRGAKINKAVEEKYKLTISKNDKGEAKTPKPTPAPAKKNTIDEKYNLIKKLNKENRNEIISLKKKIDSPEMKAYNKLQRDKYNERVAKSNVRVRAYGRAPSTFILDSYNDLNETSGYTDFSKNLISLEEIKERFKKRLKYIREKTNEYFNEGKKILKEPAPAKKRMLSPLEDIRAYLNNVNSKEYKMLRSGKEPKSGEKNWYLVLQEKLNKVMDSDIPYNIDNLFTYKKLMEFKTLKDIPRNELVKEDEVMGESINSAIQDVFTINKQKRNFGGELTLSELKRDRDREANKKAAVKREGLSKVKEIIKINKRREELCDLYSDKRYKNYESAEKKKERTEKIKKLSNELKAILKTFKTNLYFNSVICSLEELPKGLYQMLNEKLATKGNKSPADSVGKINELKFIARKVFNVDLKSLEN